MADKSFIGNLAEKAGDSLKAAGGAVGHEIAATVVSAEEQAMGKATLFEWLYGGGKKMSDAEMKQAGASDRENASEGVKKILQELTSGNQDKPGSQPTAQEGSNPHETADKVGHDGKTPEQPIHDLPNPEIDPQQAAAQSQGKQQTANPFNDNKSAKNATAQQIASASQDLFHQAQALGTTRQDEEVQKKQQAEQEEMLKQKKEKEEKEKMAPVSAPAGKKNAPGKMKARQQPLDSMETRKKRE